MKWNRKSGKRKYSQVFLTDGSILSRIAGFIKAEPEDHIVEIGPGKGALTSYLLRKNTAVTAIEIDPNLIEHLKVKFKDEERLNLINEDILKVDIDVLLKGMNENQHIWLCGNLPYDIGTAILFRFIPYRLRFKSLVFMLQREVVDRIISPPGSSDYGFISACTDYYFEKRKLLNVSPRSFRPVPAIHSTVIEFKGLITGDSTEFEEKLVELLKISFTHKRKTLYNNLTSSEKIKASREDLLELFISVGFDPMNRAEEITIEKFKKLNSILIGKEYFF
jgi:16S rRNA (adenine1518-N6/adenine1519-N6)-dimethyltransferase